MDTLRTLSFAH